VVRTQGLLCQVIAFLVDFGTSLVQFAYVAQLDCNVIERNGHDLVQFVLVLPQLEELHLFPPFQQLQRLLPQLDCFLVSWLLCIYLPR